MRKPRRILIAGAGIGGLTLAAALAGLDATVEIAEQAREFRPLGAGIVLHPNGLAMLHRLGLAEAAIARGACLTHLELWRDQTPVPIALQQVWAGARHPSVAIHRAALQELLLEGAAARHGGHLHLTMGRAVERLEWAGPEVIVHFSDGTCAPYDLVVGADGVRSKVRQALFPTTLPISLGLQYWRFCAGNAIDLPPQVWRTVEERGKSFGFVPLGPGRMYCFIQLPLPEHASYPPGGELAYLQTVLAAEHPWLATTIAAMTGPLHVTPAYTVRPHHWRQGPFALLGDAVHALSPTFSEGGSLSMEDALVLAQALRTHADFDQAFTAYEAARAPRVAWAARMGMSQVNARGRSGPRRQVDAAVATEHLRQMYQPLLQDPLALLRLPTQATGD